MTPMNMRQSWALGAALAALAGAAPASGQYFATPPAAEAATPPTIAKSGAVTINPATEAKMRQQVKAPDGFNLTLFAGPPVAMYPICVAEAADGAVYVCVDPNSSLSRIKNVGRVMRLVDEDNDGKADRYTVFAEMDSPRRRRSEEHTSELQSL